MNNQNKEYYLSISPDQRIQDLSKPLLFCEWCVNDSNKNFLSNKDYKILDNTIFEKNFNLSQIRLCDEIYENLLEEIAIKLNKIHKLIGQKKPENSNRTLVK